MAAKSQKSFQNPYRVGSYHYVVESLRKLGIGRMYAADKFVAEYRRVIGPADWKAFAAKQPRNDNGKNAESRVVQNAIVVARPDYGLPLRKVGFELRKDRDDNGYRFGLFQLPADEVKVAQQTTIVRNGGKPSKAAAKPKAKAKAKGKAKAAKR